MSTKPSEVKRWTFDDIAKQKAHGDEAFSPLYYVSDYDHDAVCKERDDYKKQLKDSEPWQIHQQEFIQELKADANEADRKAVVNLAEKGTLEKKLAQARDEIIEVEGGRDFVQGHYDKLKAENRQLKDSFDKYVYDRKQNDRILAEESKRLREEIKNINSLSNSAWNDGYAEAMNSME